MGSTIGGIPELLTPEDMVPANDAIALTDKICEVLAAPAQLEAMSGRNREKAKNFTIDKLRERRIEYYNHIKRQTELWQMDLR